MLLRISFACALLTTGCFSSERLQSPDIDSTEDAAETSEGDTRGEDTDTSTTDTRGEDTAATDADTSPSDVTEDTSPCGELCTSGEACCDTQCVDTESSRAHCGACGAACGALEVCVAGSCAPESCSALTVIGLERSDRRTGFLPLNAQLSLVTSCALRSDAADALTLHSNLRTLPANVSLDGAALTLSLELWPHERVEITLTRDLHSWDDQQLENPRVWRFQADTPDGAGSFTAGTPLGQGDTEEIVLADFDEDRDLDAFVVNSGSSNNVDILYENGGRAEFTPSSLTTFEAAVSTAAEVGDVNGDGHLDLLVTVYREPLQLYLGDGQGRLQRSTVAIGEADGLYNDLTLGDLDGDGDLDLILATGSGKATTVWLNDNGRFTSTLALGEENTLAVTLADLDDDGALDLIAAQDEGDPTLIYLGDGAGGFIDSGQELAIPRASRDVCVGDLDGDGDPDLLLPVAGPGLAQDVNVYLNDGNATMLPTTVNLGLSIGCTLVDLTHDGRPEAILARSSSELPNEIFSFSSTGGDFVSTSFESFEVGGSTYAVTAGDLNGDGAVEIVFSQFYDQENLVMVQE